MVIENGTIRKLGYGFLLVFHSITMAVSRIISEKARYWSIIAVFYTPACTRRPC